MQLEKNNANLEFLADRKMIRKESRIEYNTKFFINKDLPLYLLTFKKQKLQYLNIPKNASVTIRKYLYKIHGYGYTLEARLKFIKKEKEKYTKIVVIRDPVKRFISACKIPFLMYDYFYYPKHDLFDEIYLLKLFIFKHFDKLYKHNFKVFSHLCPQKDYMNDSLDYLIFPMEKLGDLHSFFNEKFNVNLDFKHSNNTSNINFTLKDLTPNELDFLFDFYDEDYRFLKDFYTKDKLYKEWKRNAF